MPRARSTRLDNRAGWSTAKGVRTGGSICSFPSLVRERAPSVGAEAFRRWLLETEIPKSSKSVARSLSSLPLAISEFLAIAGFSALGTVIEQNKGTAWYVQNYPTETPAFGFIDYPLILDLGLDHIYTEWYFLLLLAALAASLTACTFTRQLPVWRVSADWKFLNRPAALLKMEEAESLPRARKDDLAERLAARGYQAVSYTHLTLPTILLV